MTEITRGGAALRMSSSLDAIPGRQDRTLDGAPALAGLNGPFGSPEVARAYQDRVEETMESGSNRSSSPPDFEHMTGLVWPAHSLSHDVLDALITRTHAHRHLDLSLGAFCGAGMPSVRLTLENVPDGSGGIPVVPILDSRVELACDPAAVRELGAS